MKKMPYLLVAVVFIFSPMTSNAQAAIKEGSKCPTKGQVKSSQSKKYICVKSGKNLVWRLQVAPKSTSTPLPLTQNTSPGSDTVTEVSYLTFPQLKNSHSNLSEVTWQNFQVFKNKAKEPGVVDFNLEVGPKTLVDNKNVVSDLQFASKVFHSIKQPEKVKVFQYSFDDIDWVLNRLDSIIAPALQTTDGYRWSILTINSNCQSAKQCNGASAFKVGEMAFIYIANSSFNIDRYHKSGAIAVHEYVHLLQMEEQNSPATNTGANFQQIPSWYQEGMAHLLGSLLNSSSRSEFEQFRIELTNKRSFSGEISQEAIVGFMNDQIRPNYDRKNFLASYSAGMLMVEALNAVVGTEKLFEVYRTHGISKNFSDSFEQAFGQPLSTISPIIASVAAKYWGAA